MTSSYRAVEVGQRVGVGWFGGEPSEIKVAQVVFGMKTLQGENVGTPLDGEDTMKFGARQAIHSMIESMPLEKAPEAYTRMMDGKSTR